MKEERKKTFREITESWDRFDRGQRYMKIASTAGIGYSSITTAKSRPCQHKNAEAITKAMIKLGYVDKDTTPADLFPNLVSK